MGCQVILGYETSEWAIGKPFKSVWAYPQHYNISISRLFKIKVNSSAVTKWECKKTREWEWNQPAAWHPVLSPCNFIRPLQIFLTNITDVSINNITMASKINTELSPNCTACFSFSPSLVLSRPLPVSFLLSVQTATHTPAQSEWGSYADHFFHL